MYHIFATNAQDIQSKFPVRLKISLEPGTLVPHDPPALVITLLNYMWVNIDTRRHKKAVNSQNISVGPGEWVGYF